MEEESGDRRWNVRERSRGGRIGEEGGKKKVREIGRAIISRRTFAYKSVLSPVGEKSHEMESSRSEKVENICRLIVDSS